MDELKPCSLGVGCDEYGVCYAEAHDRPDMCPRTPPASSAFTRESRYIVIKRKHLESGVEQQLRALLNASNIPTVDAVVVERDWPEYEPVWQMIEDRVSPRTPPATQADALVEELAKAISLAAFGSHHGWQNCVREARAILPIIARETAAAHAAGVAEERAEVVAFADKFWPDNCSPPMLKAVLAFARAIERGQHKETGDE